MEKETGTGNASASFPLPRIETPNPTLPERTHRIHVLRLRGLYCSCSTVEQVEHAEPRLWLRFAVPEPVGNPGEWMRAHDGLTNRGAPVVVADPVEFGTCVSFSPCFQRVLNINLSDVLVAPCRVPPRLVSLSRRCLGGGLTLCLGSPILDLLVHLDRVCVFAGPRDEAAHVGGTLAHMHLLEHGLSALKHLSRVWGWGWEGGGGGQRRACASRSIAVSSIFRAERANHTIKATSTRARRCRPLPAHVCLSLCAQLTESGAHDAKP